MLTQKIPEILHLPNSRKKNVDKLVTVDYKNSFTCFVDENAVSFAQAEKLYYETSLINISNEAQQEQGEPGECCLYEDQNPVNPGV